MTKGKVLLYIAMSLDGFIARKGDDVSWLDEYQVKDEDYGYAEFMKTVGAVVMGARTYQLSLKHPDWLMKGVKNYVLSKQLLPTVSSVDAEFYSGSLQALVEKIRKESSKDIFILGGGQVVSSFLNEGLIEDLKIFIVPILLKEGIPLFSMLNKENKLKLIEAVPYKTGIVQLHYIPKKA